MKDESFSQTFQLPGTDQVLQFTRAPTGQLLGLQGCGRIYISRQDDGLHYDQDLAIMSETLIGNTLLRNVKTSGSNWLERYVWGDDERLIEIDGVVFDRDDRNRITSSTSVDGDSWHYRYSDEGPVAISSPTVRRSLRWQDGVPIGLSENSRHQNFSYSDGVRNNIPSLGEHFHRDELGRIWCITSDEGCVEKIFLWDGFACLARIDGCLGDPLAAVFSLDPTCTPVRIIAADKVARIPRDVFGEALLDYPGNPGLYGGLVWQGYTHLPSRSLDPRTGCFTSPDSYDGLDTDPRRQSGFKGVLFTEHESVNRYAISQFDAIGRADPTGNLSFWVYLSDFTWSLQNNLLGWFGLDWTVNLFFSLFSGRIGEFFDFEHLESSDRLGLTGVQRGGWTAETDLVPADVWTFQHLVMAKKGHISELAQARVIDPQGEFLPTLYGTVLYAAVEGNQSILLRGSNFQNITRWPGGPSNWTRSGGPAKPVAQGSNIPYFPEGGLHLDQPIPEIPEPADVSLRELVATARSVLGDFDSGREVIVIDSTSTGLAVSNLVLLTDSVANIGLFEILSASATGSSTRVHFVRDATGLAPNNVRMRLVASPDAAEVLSQTALPTHMEIHQSNRNYAQGNVLRLSQGGTEAGIRLIERFESRLETNDAVPDPFSQPIIVLAASTSGAQSTVTRTANAAAVEYPAGLSLPGIGAALVVRGSSNTLAVIVKSINARVVVVDRSLANTGGDGDDVTIQALSRGIQLGVRSDARETAAQISYTPAILRRAPNSGFLWLEDNNGQVAVRTIISRVFDALVTTQALPGDTTMSYQVERFDVRGFDRDGLSIDTEQVIVLDENINIGSPTALMMQNLDLSPALKANYAGWVKHTSSVSQVFTSTKSVPTNVITTNLPPIGRPAEALVIKDGTNDELRRVQSTRVTIQLDRSVTLTAGATAGLKAVKLGAGNSQTYIAQIVGPLSVELPGHSLANNDDVTIKFSLGGPEQTLEYRVTDVSAGNTLTLSGGQTHEIEAKDAAGVVIKNTASSNISRVSGELFAAALPFVITQQVQMPRLDSQAIIAVTWDDTLCPLKVVGINGDTVTLAHREAVGSINDLYLKKVSFKQMEPTDPANGTAWVAINGRVENGIAAGGREQSVELSFDVWLADAIPQGTLIAIVDGQRSIPCRVPDVSDIAVTIAFDRNLSTVVTSLILEEPEILQTGFALNFIREGQTLIIRDSPALFSVTTTDTVFLTPMVPATESTRLALTSRVSPGTVLVPEDPENWELDRRQSLIDHELIHTRQSANLGPLLLAWFPMYIFEAGTGIFSESFDIELPEYSAYVDAELTTVNSVRFISITDPGDIEFSRGDRVQLFVNENFETVTLVETDENNTQNFMVSIADIIADQSLRIRKQNNSSPWWETIFDILQYSTHGGLLGNLTGTVYGSLFYTFGSVINYSQRKFGEAQRYAGTVVLPDKISIILNDQAGISAFQGVNRIILQKGDSTLVRSLNFPAPGGDTLTLSSAVDFDGEVFVAPYTTHTPNSIWDWNSYYPAQVPNSAEPTAIRLLEASQGDSLSLKVFDRVRVTTGNNSRQTVVTHIRSDGIVELKDIPNTSGIDRNLRVAKIGEDDPIGSSDSNALRAIFGGDEGDNHGWMRWLFDPYGQFQYRLQPDNSSFWGVVARFSRYLFGSKSWSILPLLGDYFWDNALRGDTRYRSRAEQQSSQESGDLYTPIGRLRGAFSKNNDNYQGVVGDIGRYWYFHGNRYNSFIQRGQRDTSSMHNSDFTDFSRTHPAGIPDQNPLRIITDANNAATLTPAPAANDILAPNQNAESGGDTPALVVPDRLFNKISPISIAITATILAPASGTNPANPIVNQRPDGFSPSSSGYIPVSPVQERSLGMYVSFCRPGEHRITVANGINGAQEALDLQEGDVFFSADQSLYFNIDIRDVEVTVAGQQVTSELTPNPPPPSPITPSTIFESESIELVQLQRARVNVLPNASRRYAITVPHSGKGGQLLTNGTNEIVALNRDTPSNTPEAVEITRHYQKNTDGKYDDAVLNAHNGVHLTDDLHIPVRSFLVNVVSTLLVRGAVNLDAAMIRDPNTGAGKLHPGDVVYIIIPADPVNTLRLDTVTYPSNPAVVSNPISPLIESEPVPQALQAFVGDGVISKVTIQADNPPEVTARIILTVTVGYEELRAELKAEMEVIPHVTLQPATIISVQNNGSSIDFNSQDEGGVAVNLLQNSILLLEPDGTSATGLEATVANSTVTITATASAIPGRKQILVKKDSDEEHWARLTFEVTT